MMETAHLPVGPTIARFTLPAGEQAVLAMRAQLLASLRSLIAEQGWTQTEAMRRLGISRMRLANLLGGQWEKFDLDLLVALAARAGRKPRLELSRD